MPLYRGRDSKGCYFKWNLNGKKCRYTVNDRASCSRAKARAKNYHRRRQAMSGNRNRSFAGGVRRRSISRNKRHYRSTCSGAGMTKTGVQAYRRLNPGSRLQTAVTEEHPRSESRAKRRKSFCARSAGQARKHGIICSQTPNKRLCQARRRWRC